MAERKCGCGVHLGWTDWGKPMDITHSYCWLCRYMFLRGMKKFKNFQKAKIAYNEFLNKK